MAFLGISLCVSESRFEPKVCDPQSSTIYVSSIQPSAAFKVLSPPKSFRPFFTPSPHPGLNPCFWTSKSVRNTQIGVLPKLPIRRAHVGRIDTVEGLTIRALRGGGRSPRRLVDVIRAVSRISKGYFESPFRRALYGGIALLGGFYVAQTISRSFGALGVNDVIAATFCVLIAEYITKFYHNRTRMTFTIALLNNFKVGFTYGLFIDAFKLAS